MRTNAQLAPIEEALTRAGIAYVVRGLRFYDRPEVRGAVTALRRQPALDAHGVRLLAAIRERWTEALGYEPEAVAEGNEAQERQASLDTLLAIVEGLTRGDPHIELAGGPRGPRRAGRPRAAGSADGVNLLTLHRAKGPRVGRGVPAGPRGGRAADPPGDGRRRGARRGAPAPVRRAHPGADAPRAVVGGAARDAAAGSRAASRAASCSTCGRGPAPGSRIRELPGPPVVRAAPKPRAGGDPDDPLFAALREWRTGVARDEAMPPYVIAHDATLAAIAEARPRSLAALRRVKGMGPTKTEKYGDEILAVLERVGE